MFTVYVLKNEAGKIYIGQTNDLGKRLRRHNKDLPSKSSSYTNLNKGVWRVFYSEEYNTRSEALTREKYLKLHVGREWLKTITAR